ncbi:MAG: spermidine synthase, partial [Candidatus Binatia bacterium]
MSAARASWRADASLVAVSAAVLTLEVLQTKIFAFSLDPLSIYLAVAVCMLGLSAAATMLALVRPPTMERAARLAALGSSGGAIAIVVAHVLFARWSPAVRSGGLGVLVTLVGLVLPYFGFGITTTLLMMNQGERIGRAYALNLAGSGLGCLLVFPFLDAFGAERSLPLIGFVGVLAGGLLAPARSGARAAVGIAGLVLAGTFAAGPRLFAFQPDPTGQLAVILDRAAKLNAQHGMGAAEVTPALSRWDRTGRIDVVRLASSRPELQGRIGGPVETLFYVQDASAGSFLLGVGDDLGRAGELFERTVYGAGYVTGPKRAVLVIGLGGGPDVLAALYHGASRIVGVEINRTAIEMIQRDLADFVGRPYDRSEVTLHVLDGRTFLRQSSETFDLIQLSGVDTKSVFFASGGLALNESYLYTREAMGEMLRRLRPDGLIAINRFGQLDVQRLTSVAVAGLRDLGVADPQRHIMAVGQGFWRSVLVKRSPFTAAEIGLVTGWAKRTAVAPPIVIPAYDWIGVSFQYPLQVFYTPGPSGVTDGAFFEALAAGTLDEFIAAQWLDFSPPDDDRPFYFFPIRPRDILRGSAPGLDEVLRLARWLAVLSVVVIVLPLVVWQRRGLRTRRAGRALVYFASLGIGFMFLEIGLIHRFVLLLGHQTYAITVVLFGLLCGAGIGSACARRVTRLELGRLRVALAVLVAGVVVVSLGLGAASDWMAPFGFASR